MLDLPVIVTAYECEIRSLCHGSFPEAVQLHDRLDPTNWALEWSLAEWLGRAFGLDAATRFEFTLSNVLGLAFVRVQDDISDGDLDPVPHAELAAGLFEAALRPYQRRFAPESSFWARLEHYLSSWRHRDREHPGDATPMMALGNRGAPLKISAYAICLLAERLGEFPRVEEMLDHAMRGMVLYDHLIDWREDLGARRWNAFVSSSHGANATERDVVLAMLTTDIVETYFARIEDELESAQRLAVALSIHGLAHHLQALRGDIERQGRHMAAHYHAVLGQAQSLFFTEASRRGNGE